jgi:hypothetical protein
MMMMMMVMVMVVARERKRWLANDGRHYEKLWKSCAKRSNLQIFEFLFENSNANIEEIVHSTAGYGCFETRLCNCDEEVKAMEKLVRRIEIV